MKGQLDVAFPIQYKTATSAVKTLKKCTVQPMQMRTPSAAQLTPLLAPSSVQRPLKKIRICYDDGQKIVGVDCRSQTPPMSRNEPAAESIVPPLKKFRLQRRNVHGDLEYSGNVIQVHECDAATDNRRDACSIYGMQVSNFFFLTEKVNL